MNKLFKFIKQKLTKKFIIYVIISIFVTVIGIVIRYFAYDIFGITVLLFEPVAIGFIWIIRYFLQVKFKVIENW